MDSYNICPFVSAFFSYHNDSKAHPHHCMHRYSVLFMPEQYSIVWIQHSLCIPLSIGGHLVLFLFSVPFDYCKEFSYDHLCVSICLSQ